MSAKPVKKNNNNNASAAASSADESSAVDSTTQETKQEGQRDDDPGSDGDRPEDDAQPVDLGFLMAPLSREDLEMLVVQMIMSTPDHIELLEKAVAKDVSQGDLRTDVEEALASSDEDLEFALARVEAIVNRAADYSRAQQSRNALRVLEAVTDPFAMWCEVSEFDADEERPRIDAAFGTLESAWVAAIKAHHKAGKLTPTRARELMVNLERHKRALTPVLGPMFSDPVRTLSRIAGKPRAFDETSGSVASAAAASKKKKKKSKLRSMQQQPAANSRSNNVGKKRKAASESVSESESAVSNNKFGIVLDTNIDFSSLGMSSSEPTREPKRARNN